MTDFPQKKKKIENQHQTDSKRSFHPKLPTQWHGYQFDLQRSCHISKHSGTPMVENTEGAKNEVQCGLDKRLALGVPPPPPLKNRFKMM